MQAPNIVDARPPEHSDGDGRGLASDGIEFTEYSGGVYAPGKR